MITTCLEGRKLNTSNLPVFIVTMFCPAQTVEHSGSGRDDTQVEGMTEGMVEGMIAVEVVVRSQPTGYQGRIVYPVPLVRADAMPLVSVPVAVKAEVHWHIPIIV